MYRLFVALRKESVDRNSGLGSLLGAGFVALRKESVDRNDCPGYIGTADPAESLSARRAWIEIMIITESYKFKRLSLSARRAWIEIVYRSVMV